MNSISESRLMRPVDRRIPPKPIKGESFAMGLMFFTCFSESSNFSYVANVSFCERSKSFNFAFSNIKCMTILSVASR